MALSDLDTLAREAFAQPDNQAAYEALENELAKHTRAESEAALSRFIPQLTQSLAESAPLTTFAETAPPPPIRSLPVELPAPRAPSPAGSVPRVPKPAWNWAGNERIDGGAGSVFRIGTRADALRVVQDVLAMGAGAARSILALGVAHSASAVVQPQGTMVETGWLDSLPTATPDGGVPTVVELHRVSELRRAWYRPSVDCAHHVGVGAGARVCDVTDALSGTGRALAMLGAYTQQTLVGAICTGTHGSGLGFGPVHTLVRSVQLIGASAGAAKEYRIEPTEGITNLASYSADNPTVELIQDDAQFEGALVGLGNFGIVTSMILEVVPAFSLASEHLHMDWLEARALLTPHDVAGRPSYLAGTYSGGVFLSPYAWPLHTTDPSGRGRQHAVLSRSWLKPIKPAGAVPPSPANLPSCLTPLIRFVANATTLAPLLLDIVVGLSNGSRLTWGPSYAMLADSGNLPRGYSVEYAFPLSEFPAAADDLFATMAGLADARETVMGTTSIRFVQGDAAPLSMTEGGDRFFVEILTLSKVTAAPRVFAALQPIALKHHGRPHWGQWWDPSPASVKAMLAGYPKLAAWTIARSAIDPAGLFGEQIPGLRAKPFKSQG